MSASWRRWPLCRPAASWPRSWMAPHRSISLPLRWPVRCLGRAGAAGRDRSRAAHGRVLRPTLTLLAKCVQRQRTSAGQTLGNGATSPNPVQFPRPVHEGSAKVEQLDPAQKTTRFRRCQSTTRSCEA
jgi:hypothetical protein